MGTAGIEENAKSTLSLSTLGYTPCFLHKFVLSPHCFHFHSYLRLESVKIHFSETMSTSLLTMHFGTTLSSHPSINNNFTSASLWESCEYLSVILAFAEPVITLRSGMDSQGISHSGSTSMSALLITLY